MPGAVTFRFADVPRYQRVLFIVFLSAILLMSAALWQLRRVEQQRISSNITEAQIAAPLPVATSNVQLLVANDRDDSLQPSQQKLVLPDSPNAAARQILLTLLAQSSKPDSKHPVPAGPSIEDVFILPLPGNLAAAEGNPVEAQLAIINLNAGFTHAHPSNLAAETLTIQSILATLHANFPQIHAARFLVDGQQNDTLAGHADLRSMYSTTPPFDTIAPVAPPRPRKRIPSSVTP